MTPPLSDQRPDLRRRRLWNQRLIGPRFSSPAAVVRWLGGLQGQDYGQAMWAIGVRTRDSSRADVEKAIAERAIVLTWPFRGTLHFVPAEDAGWMVGLLAPRRLARDGARLRNLQLDERTIDRATQALQRALAGGRRLTRPAVMQLFDRAGIDPAGQRGYHLLWHIAQEGVICLGPLEGKQQTFVLLDEWVRRPRKLSRDEGLAEIARRYFRSHGPATLHDFANWTGLPMADARQALDVARRSLTVHQHDGKDHWATDAVDRSADAPAGVHLLPGFDEYLLGYKHRAAVLAARHADLVVPGGNGIFKPTIAVDGQIVGTWSRAVQKGGVAITLQPFARRAVARRDVAAAAERYAAFLGLPLLSLASSAVSGSARRA